jgi:acyl carrier protein
MQEVKKTLHDYFKVKTDAAFADDDNLFNNGLLDSMGVLELVYHLETKLAIEVDPDDISENNFRTIDSIAALASGKLQ